MQCDKLVLRDCCCALCSNGSDSLYKCMLNQPELPEFAFWGATPLQQKWNQGAMYELLTWILNVLTLKLSVTFDLSLTHFFLSLKLEIVCSTPNPLKLTISLEYEPECETGPVIWSQLPTSQWVVNNNFVIFLLSHNTNLIEVGSKVHNRSEIQPKTVYLLILEHGHRRDCASGFDQQWSLLPTKSA